MLVNEYLDQVIKSRAYKYSTKQTLVKDIKRMGIWNMDTSEITSALIRDKVDSESNHNSRRRLYITARSIILEYADEHALYGLCGVGEPPTISSTPAIVSAIRAATGLALTRIPIRPEHITSTM